MSGLDDDDDFLNDIYAEDKPKVEPKVEEPTPAPAPAPTSDPRLAAAPSAPAVAPVTAAPSAPAVAPVAPAPVPAPIPAPTPSTLPNGDLIYRSDGNAALGNIVIPPKDEGKMFIGGLNWETTDESLTNYFAQFGEVLECTVMRDHFSGKSRGFGFLTFRDPKCVNAVMAKEHYLDGKIIDPKRAIPREEQDKTSKIFVGGVGSDVTEEDYKQFFEQYGTVIDAQLMIDKDSGRPRGFGFVTFDSEQAMNSILAQPLLILKDKPIEVKRAENRSKGAGASAVANAVAGPHGGHGYGGNNNNNNHSSHNNNNYGAGAETAPQNSYGGMTPQAMTQWWQQYMQYMQQVQQMQGGAGADPEAQQAMMAQMMAQMQGQQQQQQQGQGQGQRDHRDQRDDDSGDDNEMRRVDRGRDDRSGRRGRGYNQSDRRSRSPGVPTGPRDGRNRGRRHGGGRGRDRRDGGRAPGYHPYGGSRERQRRE
ncbi:putative RNA-binding protein [Yarrowia sp. C11]|nr:putative RNA-binding protein [Yarrowia sp. E02]KAG5371617.1 putative RNA-binding protein [Yarrowia sp. C11]